MLSFYSPATNLHSSQAGCLLCSPHNLSTSATQANSSAVLAIWSNLLVYLHLYSSSPPPSSPSLTIQLHEWLLHSLAVLKYNKTQENRKPSAKIKPLETMWYYPAYTAVCINDRTGKIQG